MSIRELNIRGFRSLRDVTWRPGRLNVLIGPNGSGKSNLMRALSLLQAAVRGKLEDAIVAMGGIAPLLWDGQVKEIAWGVQTDLRYELCIQRLGGGVGYRVVLERLTSVDEGGSTLIDRSGRGLTVPNGPDVEWVDVPSTETAVAKLPRSAFRQSAPDVATEPSAFWRTVVSWALYHDVRVDPEAPLRQAAVARMTRRLDPDGQNLIPVLHTLYTGDRNFKRTLDDAMRAAFGGDYEELVFPPAADQRVQLRVRWRSLQTEQSAADLSDGTIRFLLLLAVLANPEPGALVWIDEPEVGLHPSMFPIVAELAAEAAGRTQVVLTTHSTQLLDAFTSEPPTTTVARWERGETHLSILDPEELARWLEEYSLGALFRTGELEGMA